jgi:8-oxo-dGTP pyrophosphatase MutT (NUDIX family)
MLRRGSVLRLPRNIEQNGSHSPEEPVHGTGVIFELSEGRYLFFRRHDNPDIPHPGKIALIGGRCLVDETGRTYETGREAALREVEEELYYKETGMPFIPDPDKLNHLATLTDDRPGIIDVFTYKLDFEAYELLDIREDEGEELVMMSAEAALELEFPYVYGEVTHSHIRDQQAKLMADFCLSTLSVAVE